MRDSKSGLNGVVAPILKKRTSDLESKYSQTDVMRIIRVQALIRGFLDRRRFAAFKREIANNQGNYFAKEEMLETTKN